MTTSKHNKASSEVQRTFEEVLLLHKPPPVKVEHARIPTQMVQLDPENPRLKYLRVLKPSKSLSELLFDDRDTNWLMKDVQEKGLLEPIYVRALEKGWKAVEGNRRTTVMQALHAKFPDEPRFAYIPARILPAETTEEQEALLMASYHVAGKVKWSAHEKAGQIWRMIYQLHIPESELATTLHMGAPAIRKAAESYILLEHYKSIDDGKYGQEAEGKWSFFAEMFKQKVFRDEHKKQGQAWDDKFCRWVGEGRIPKAEDVRELASIWKVRRARDVFQNEEASSAFESAKLLAQSPARSSKFFKDLQNLIISCRGASANDMDAAENNEEAREMTLEGAAVLKAFMERANLQPPATGRR